MADPTPEERLERLTTALSVASPLSKESGAKWEAGCEGAFTDFRLRCVHLRRERATLDLVQDKNGAWHFISRFSRSRPFMHDRCIEVLKIFMQSDLWMQAYADDPDLNINDLPPGIIAEFTKRVKEVRPDFEPPQAPPPPEPIPSAPPDPVTTMRPSNCAVVVQRCSSAKILVDERAQTWEQIGRGLVIFVSFAKGAKEDVVPHAARFLLTAKLSTRDAPGGAGSPQASLSRSGSLGRTGSQRAAPGEAESIATLCRQGAEQGLLVLPQETLCSELDKDNIGLQYGHVCPRNSAEALLDAFVNALRTISAEMVGNGRVVGAKELKIISGGSSASQNMEMTSAGPFMHAFNF
mmetsp:Transcript_98975/g.284405  ORF Transcript_98975/g.284405 Transcript_98975/m.284405 type:complete len:351 (+) Transcript_98975:44-1096(+)